MELEIENTEVVSSNEIQVEVPNSIEVTEGEKDYEVSVVKKEYTIIGDSIFIPSMYEDVPPWLKEFINTTLEVAITNRDQSLIDRLESLLSLLDYVPKNKYTEQINQIVSEDGIINSRIATLNSNLTDALSSTNATIAEINLTYASKDEAAAIATNALTASLSGNGEIGSALIELQEAYANLESTTAQSINMLESVMEGEINGNATAMETIRTYVGIDEAGASTHTGLSAYLESSDGTIGGADSQLANTIRVTAEGVESKFAYNSVVNINGIYKRSGFGLTTDYTSGSGTEANPYVSEFWIDASRFKFTNSNVTGSVAPFTIDATGTTPQITFNGKVSFGNVLDVPQLGSTPQEVVDAVNNGQTTTINGGKITTGSISADKISTYNLTSANATLQNSMITNAMIRDAQITSAKIQDLSVSTLKIQDEAVVVPRSASGGYSCTIYYTPNISHAATILGEWVQGVGRNRTLTKISINGTDVRGETPNEGTLCTMFYNTYFYSNTTYTITLYTVLNTGYMTCRLLMLGTKK